LGSGRFDGAWEVLPKFGTRGADRLIVSIGSQRWQFQLENLLAQIAVPLEQAGFWAYPEFFRVSDVILIKGESPHLESCDQIFPEIFLLSDEIDLRKGEAPIHPTDISGALFDNVAHELVEVG